MRGQIPIMMIPCKKFKLEDDMRSRIKMLKKHYMRCEECEKINNGNIELSVIIEEAKIKILKMSENDRVKEMILAYHSLEKYDPREEYKDNYIKCIYIHDTDSIYHECIIITWKIK